MNCGTCKWWTPSEDGFYNHEGEPIMSRQCESPKLLKFAPPAEDGASLMDGSYYRALMFTGPKFGCVKWEGKE